jgi:hypothetical protein
VSTVEAKIFEAERMSSTPPDGGYGEPDYNRAPFDPEAAHTAYEGAVKALRKRHEIARALERGADKSAAVTIGHGPGGERIRTTAAEYVNLLADEAAQNMEAARAWGGRHAVNTYVRSQFEMF